jgi:hypothetical protein
MKFDWKSLLPVFYKFITAVIALLLGVNQVQMAYKNEELKQDVQAIQQMLQSHSDVQEFSDDN